MPHALLLSPDDQAVSAITGVLEEMSVTCERPLDGASAAQKLNSHSFDLVLVDCENLPAAKLIFDVCRRGKGGNNPVPIAIVDGRAGLPTAFRLGAELILTKPVAKDQARTTIRTAVSRVRKDVQTKESVPAPPESVVMPSAAIAGAAPNEKRAQAAAAAAGSAQLPSFAEPTPARAIKMHSAVDEIGAPLATQKSSPPPAPFSTSSLSDLSESPSARTNPASSKPARPVQPSDDPVLAELEESELGSSERDKAAPEQSAGESFAPVFSSYPQRPQKKRGPLVALLVLAIACGGFYAAWMYQPGFRAIAQPQIDRVLALAGAALPPQHVSPAPAPSPAKPAAQLAPATTSTPAPVSPADPAQAPSTAPDSKTSSTTSSAAGATTTPPAATVPVEPAAAPAASSEAQLPGEDSAIILSSKGAERRLARSVPPKYPVEARSGGAEGTIVLKAVVDETGKVEGLRLVEGNAILATAAMQAVKQWRYRPYVRYGKAQPFQTIVIVDFQRP